MENIIPVNGMMSDRFHELRVFVAVADTGGLSKAAAVLESSPPSVTRTIAALETRLGVRLFERTTRSLRLTEPGTTFLEDARRVLTDLEAAEQEISGQSASARGHLTVTASLTFGRAMLQPVVLDFLDAFPNISVSMVLLDRVVDLVEEGFDLAVRIANLPESSLVARNVGEVRRMLVASPGYLAAQGTPATAEDLKGHAIITQSALMPNQEWRYANGGKPARIKLPARLEINDAHACIAAALRNRGITIALSYMVAEHIARGELRAVLAHLTPPPVPVNMVYAQRRLIPPKLRAFLDFAAPRLKSALADQASL
jgi:DNA-binding transcriptional LysR family regulator